MGKTSDREYTAHRRASDTHGKCVMEGVVKNTCSNGVRSVDQVGWDMEVLTSGGKRFGESSDFVMLDFRATLAYVWAF